MPAELTLGQAYAAVMRAAAALVDRSKPGGEEWAIANAATNGLARLLAEIDLQTAELARRATVPIPGPVIAGPADEPAPRRPPRPAAPRPAPDPTPTTA